MRAAGRILSAVGAALALVPAGAAAQLKPEMQTGSMIPVQPRAVEADQAGRIRKGFAQCVYRMGAKGAVVRLLTHSDPGTVDLKAAGVSDLSRSLSMETCLGRELQADQSTLGYKFTPKVLRGMMMEEAYLSTFAVLPPRPATMTQAVDRTFVSTGDALSVARGLAEFADCVVFKDPEHADALLRTVPNSVAEKTAARALAPALGSCLTAGQTVALNAASIRVFMADGLWNRYVRPTIRQ
ncbi:MULTISPECIES: hypothetical protein [unclassified Sphingomonas]|jgi:hypothetical protein|nr:MULTISPECIES: hypothetical protein [unclassified Sphingomonas]AXJ96720.1 hypothetical protein DM480_15725 [Sphingomonas sp. FARSPH]